MFKRCEYEEDSSGVARLATKQQYANCLKDRFYSLPYQRVIDNTLLPVDPMPWRSVRRESVNIPDETQDDLTAYDPNSVEAKRTPESYDE